MPYVRGYIYLEAQREADVRRQEELGIAANTLANLARTKRSATIKTTRMYPLQARHWMTLA